MSDKTNQSRQVNKVIKVNRGKMNHKIKTARDFFPVLKTLVAPILPEPISLISFFKNIFVIINPNGIEPIR